MLRKLPAVLNWGLRAYGTDPQVWGGDKACVHEWRSAGVLRKGVPQGAGGQRADRDVSAQNAAQSLPAGDICLRCNAWRGELGSEPTIRLFVEHIVEVFAEVWRVLRDDGALWCNMGDSYCSTAPGTFAAGSSLTSTLVRHARLDAQDAERAKSKRPPTPEGLKPKDLCGIPWRCAFALQEAGWYLRSDIPWVKRAAMPESVADRPAKALEYVFLLTKSQRYFFDMEAVRRKGSGVSGGACFGAQTKISDADKTQDGGHAVTNGGLVQSRKLASKEERAKYDAGRNFRNADLWFESVSRDGLCGIGDELVGLDVTPEAFSGAHFATFPRRLIEPLIKAGTSEKGCCAECGAQWGRVVERTAMVLARSERQHDKGRTRSSGTMLEPPKSSTTGWQPSCSCNAACIPCTVLDPFLGSGTTGLVSEALGRSWIGVELNEQYAEIARKRIAAGYEPPKQAKPLKAQLTLISGEDS